MQMRAVVFVKFKYAQYFSWLFIFFSFNIQLSTRDFNRRKRNFFQQCDIPTPVAGNYRQINDMFSHPIVFLMKAVNKRNFSLLSFTVCVTMELINS